MPVIRWQCANRISPLEHAPGTDALERLPTRVPDFLLFAFLLAASIPIASAQTLVEFDLPPAVRAQGIAAGPDGNAWFTDRAAGAIGRITFEGAVTTYRLPAVSSDPVAIVAGPDGQLWFTERRSGKLGRITIDGVVTNEFDLGPFEQPDDVTSGPDGSLWVAANAISRVTTSGAVTAFRINYAPVGAITAGPDANLWFIAPSEYGSKICRITTQGELREFGGDLRSDVADITTGPDGNLWFTEPLMDRIGRITPQGFITEFALPSGTMPWAITAARDGTLWFTEDSRNRIGQLSTAGVLLNEITLPSPDSHASSIVATPAGAIWFTETPASRIGRVIPKEFTYPRRRASRH